MKTGKLLDWGKRKEDSRGCFCNTTIAMIKEYGNTIMSVKEFTKGVRTIHKQKYGTNLGKYKHNYITTTDGKVVEAVSEWITYLSDQVGFKIKIRECSKSYTGAEDVPCIVIERDLS